MMKKNLFILVVLFYASSIITLSEDRANFYNEQSIYTQKLVDDLSSRAPIDVIIALDSSTSMINLSNESREIALNFLKYIKNEKKDSIRIGYVSWSHNATLFEPPINEYSNIEGLINKTVFSGNTCFSIGINKSVELLNENTQKNVGKAVVFISDGMENCNKTGNDFRCSDLERMRDSGISFYAISTVGNKSETFQCLENIPESLPYKSSYPDGKSTIIMSDELANPFVLQARGREIQIKEPNTNVTVTKRIEGGVAGPRIVLIITVPPAKEIKNSIVLALDSSGSFGLGGRPDNGVIVRKAIPNVLADTAEYYPNTNISILSWDDNFDFAYSNLTNKNPKNATMVPIGQAMIDIANNHVFIPAEKYKLYSIPFTNYQFSVPLVNIINPEYNEDFYYCQENESTNLSVGVRGAIDILDANYPEEQKDIKDTAGKSIILITGRSEYTECKPEIIAEAKKKDYKIYPVGLGVIKESRLRTSLDGIASNSGGRYQYSPNNLEWTEKAVSTDIFGAIKETLMRTIADDIIIKESLYPYLNVTNIDVKSNGSIIKNPFKKNPLMTRKGQTWEMELNEGLKAGDILEIDMETEFNMALPVDVTANMTRVNFDPETGTVPSSVTYNWRDINEYTLPLPENRIII